MSERRRLRAADLGQQFHSVEGVTADERRALYELSDAWHRSGDYSINTEPRNEREAHSCMADACAQGRKPCPCPDACRLPSGSSEIPNWLLAVLLGVALAVVLFIAPGAWQ